MHLPAIMAGNHYHAPWGISLLIDRDFLIRSLMISDRNNNSNANQIPVLLDSDSVFLILAEMIIRILAEISANLYLTITIRDDGTNLSPVASQNSRLW